MKLQKLALTALALAMSTAFAAGNTDKKAEGSSANQAAMASSDQAAPSGANQSASTNGSQSGMASQGAAQADPQVRQVQQALKDKGHDPGSIDGVMGPKTHAALQSFQQQQGN